jgi:adenosylmethionine-8-amino-7-oxononanoate aminotransferase
MKDECQEQIVKISKAHTSFKEQLKGDDRVKETRSQGTILAVELKTEGESTYSNTLRKRIYPFFLERDILLRPLGNTIYMVPPYVITEDELQKVYSGILEFVATLP